MIQEELGKHFELYPSCWEVVNFFIRCQTQWLVGMGGRTGLNYPGVESLARILRVKLTPEFFGDLQLMESTVIKELNQSG